jgi:hypothetical protein
MRKLLLSLVLIVGLVGCEKNLLKPTPTVYSEESKALAAKLVDTPKDKLELAYKQSSGLSEFMKNTNSINSTADLARVMTDFKGLYKNTPNIPAIDTYFKDRSYDDVTKFDEVYREKVIKDFSIVADAIKITLESKNE